MTAITFPRAALATRDLLRALLKDRPERVAQGVTVSTKTLPGSDTRRPVPYVQARSDGRFRNSRLDGRETVRLAVWAKDEGDAEDLAALCEALLIDARSEQIRGVKSTAGPLTTFDDEAGLPLAFVTLTVRTRPIQLT